MYAVGLVKYSEYADKSFHFPPTIDQLTVVNSSFSGKEEEELMSSQVI